MLILAPGPDSPVAALASMPQRAARTDARPVCEAGFSLLEILVVLAIIGIATTTVSIGVISNGDARALRQDALRLAQLFSVAQAEARQGGRSVIWGYSPDGYHFERAAREPFLPSSMARRASDAGAESFAGNSPLRPRHWSSDRPIQVRIDPPTANVFNAEWVSGPHAVELTDGANTIRILRSGTGRYQVRP